MNNYDPILGKGIDKIIEGASKGPVETFSKTWELVFGKFHLYVDKVIYQREVEFEKFKEQFKKKYLLYLKIIYKNHNFLF